MSETSFSVSASPRPRRQPSKGVLAFFLAILLSPIISPVFAEVYYRQEADFKNTYYTYNPIHNTGHIVRGLYAGGLSYLGWRASANTRAGSRDFCKAMGIAFGIKAVYAFGGGD